MMTKVEDFICRYWNILYDILYIFFHNEIRWNILYDLVLTMEYFIWLFHISNVMLATLHPCDFRWSHFTTDFSLPQICTLYLQKVRLFAKHCKNSHYQDFWNPTSLSANSIFALESIKLNNMSFLLYQYKIYCIILSRQKPLASSRNVFSSSFFFFLSFA